MLTNMGWPEQKVPRQKKRDDGSRSRVREKEKRGDFEPQDGGRAGNPPILTEEQEEASCREDVCILSVCNS